MPVPSVPPCSDSHYQGNALRGAHPRAIVHAHTTHLGCCTNSGWPTHSEQGAGPPAWAHRPACTHKDAATRMCTCITLMYTCTHTHACTMLPGSNTPPRAVPGLPALWEGTARDEKLNTERMDANPPGAAMRVHACQPLRTNTRTHVFRLSRWDSQHAVLLRCWQTGWRMDMSCTYCQAELHPPSIKLLLFRHCFLL